MKIFVATWFFPPATSSEGLVTYKLLRNSAHEYDVFSSTSENWGYKATTALKDEANIHSYTITTDSIDEWVDACIAKFEELHAQRRYDCIMTRSMPPEAILVGKAVHEKHPEVKWIASFADPIANNPYEIKAYIDDNPALDPEQKIKLKNALRSNDEDDLAEWEALGDAGIRLMCKLRRWENYARKNAALIISPTARQLKHMLGCDSWMPKFMAVPHSFDPSFYPEAGTEPHDKVTFLFTGYSDAVRSLVPFIQAVRMLKENGSPAIDRMHFEIVGNTPHSLRHMVLNYYMEDLFTFRSGVDYYDTLRLMKQADWLLHVDAYFVDLKPSGSIFFAGKIADYMGAGKPILALTGEGSPADKIVQAYGGLSCLPWELEKLSAAIERIVLGGEQISINEAYRTAYSAVEVAKQFDRRVDDLCGSEPPLRRTVWPELQPSQDEKVLSVCVPSFNAEVFLDRCIRTLIDHDMAPWMEVLVVNDGSKDRTAAIAAEYAQRYPGIVRLIDKPNGGHGSTINRAIEEAKGVYFKNVDSDDWVDSENLAGLIRRLRDEIRVDAISSDYDEVDLSAGSETPMLAGSSIAYDRAYRFGDVDPEDCYFTIHSLTIRTEILKNMNMRLQEHTFFVDCEYILFPVPFINSFMFLSDRIYKYSRGNPEQSVDTANMVRRYDHHDRVIRRCIEYGSTAQMTPEQHAYYDATLKRLLNTHYLLSLYYDKDLDRGCARAKDFDQFLGSIRPDLFDWAGRELEVVTEARKTGYDAQAFKAKRDPEVSMAFFARLGRKLSRLFAKIREA